MARLLQFKLNHVCTKVLFLLRCPRLHSNKSSKPSLVLRHALCRLTTDAPIAVSRMRTVVPWGHCVECNLLDAKPKAWPGMAPECAAGTTRFLRAHTGCGIRTKWRGLTGAAPKYRTPHACSFHTYPVCVSRPCLREGTLRQCLCEWLTSSMRGSPASLPLSLMVHGKDEFSGNLELCFRYTPFHAGHCSRASAALRAAMPVGVHGLKLEPGCCIAHRTPEMELQLGFHLGSSASGRQGAPSGTSVLMLQTHTLCAGGVICCVPTSDINHADPCRPHLPAAWPHCGTLRHRSHLGTGYDSAEHSHKVRTAQVPRCSLCIVTNHRQTA